MKISITPISVSKMFQEKKLDLHGFVNYCAEMNIDGVDILDSKSYPWLWKNVDGELKELPKWIEKAGLKLAAYAAGNNFTKPDEKEFLDNVERVKSAIREARDTGAKVLRIFGGYHKENVGETGMTTSRGLEKIVRGIELCLPDAEKCGIVMAIENHGGLPAHSWEIKSLIDIFGSPFLKCTFDCANFMTLNLFEPEDPFRAYERLKGHIAHVHFKDMGPSVVAKNKSSHGYVSGKGIVPLRQLAALFEENNYEGFCSLEYEGSIMTPEECGVPQSIEFMKEIRAALNFIKGKSRK